MAPLTVHCTGDDFQGEVHLEQKSIYWLGWNIMAVTWEVTIFISPPRRKIINGSSSFLGRPYMYKNNAREDVKNGLLFSVYTGDFNLYPTSFLSLLENVWNLPSCLTTNVGHAVASWLVVSSPDWVVRVRALAGDIVLCSWARHFTLTVPLYKCASV